MGLLACATGTVALLLQEPSLPVPNDDPFFVRMREVAAEADGDPEALLRRAIVVCEASPYLKSWVELSFVFDVGIEMSCRESNFGETEYEYEYVIAQDTRLLCDLFPVEWYFGFPAHDSTLGAPKVGIRSDSIAAIEFERVVASIDEHSELGKALRSPVVARVREEYPVLDRIEFGINRVWLDTIGEPTPMFISAFRFARSREDLEAGAWIDCDAFSWSPRYEGQEPRGWRIREFGSAADCEAMPRDFESLLKTESSPHVLLMRGTRLLERTVVGREWTEVAEVLTRSGWEKKAERSVDEGIDLEYALPGPSPAIPTGFRVVVELEVRNHVDVEGRMSRTVKSGSVGFVVDLARPYLEVLNDASLGRDTAWGLCLRHEELAEYVEEHPVLDSLAVRYSTLLDRWRLDDPRGFLVRVHLAGDASNPKGRASATFSVASGLEPATKNGTAVIVEDFVARDTLGEVRLHGGQRSHKVEPPTNYVIARRGVSPTTKAWSDPAAVDVRKKDELAALPLTTTSVRITDPNVSDADLSLLTRLVALEHLDLGACTTLTDAGLRPLASIQSLRSLILAGNEVSGHGMAVFEDAVPLVRLSILYAHRLDGEGVRSIAKLRSLESLNLHWAESLTDKEFEVLGKLESLRELSLWGAPKLDRGGVWAIASLPRLERLTFSHVSNGAVVRDLATSTSLKHLRLGIMNIRDDAIERLASIATLESLELHGASFRDDGILELRALRGVRRLVIEHCGGVSRKGVEKLLAELGEEFDLFTD